MIRERPTKPACVLRLSLVVNARVAIDPDVLRQHVQRVIDSACRSRAAEPAQAKTQSFRPGRPQPTHRYAK